MKKMLIILSLTMIMFYSCNDVNSSNTDNSGNQSESHEIKLTETGTIVFGKSGVSVSDDGTTVAVGDEKYGGNKGVVFIYRKSGGTWTRVKKLTASDASSSGSYMYFGNSICLSSDGSVILIGASSDNSKSIESGSVYIYSGTNWETETKLTASDGKDSDYFGSSVSLSDNGSVALVGAYRGDSASVTDCGAAYVYSGNDWGTETKLAQPKNIAGSASFGGNVSLSADGTTALITSQGAESAYIYSGSKFSTRVDLAPTATYQSKQRFGDSAKISSNGNMAVIGAPGYQANQGIIYAYSGDWTAPKVIQASNKGSYSDFGRILGMSGDAAVIMTSRFLNSPYYLYTYSGSGWSTEDRKEVPEYWSLDLSNDGSVVLCGLSNSVWVYY